MGGRGLSSGIGGFPGVPDIAGLKDSDDFRTFTRQNMDNPEFKAFGRSEGMAAVKQMWYARQVQKEDIHEISKEDAIAIVRDNIPQNVRDGWFRDADSDYKPILMDAVASNPGTYNAGLNIAYHNYKDKIRAARCPSSSGYVHHKPCTEATSGSVPRKTISSPVIPQIGVSRLGLAATLAP